MTHSKGIYFNSFNTRGLGDSRKRRTIFQWLKSYHNGITLLQETHSVEAIESLWMKEWGGHILYSHGNNLSRGVAVLFPKNLDYEIKNCVSDDFGRFLILELNVNEYDFLLINGYAPTEDKERDQIDFLEVIKQHLRDHYDKNIIIGGDFNVCPDPLIDKKGGTKESISTYSNMLEDVKDEFNVTDIWRVLNPDSSKFTWRGNTKRGIVQSRLDFWLLSTHMIYDITGCDIKPGIKSDHSIISISFIKQDTHHHGKGFWKFNASLLKDTILVDKVKDTIANCNVKYSHMQNKALAWDVTKCEIRSEILSYSVWKAKESRRYGKTLENNLIELEKQLDNGIEVHTEYNNLKTEFENYNEEKAKGVFIRSRVQHFEEDEKCTKYFIQQEKRNYLSKNIKCLKTDTGTITDPCDILKEQKLFYQTLYKKDDQNVCQNQWSLLDHHFPQLTDLDKAMCDQDITIAECGKSLCDLPNNKAPGSDGFTADFYKFFWTNIKTFVCNSFQYAYQHNMLSIDQRRAVLTLLPKPNKDIRFLKNWRPLSLLNTDYKILTKLLANRLQKVLPYLISEDQAGCLKNRFIGENIRKIIDIFEHTYLKKDPGLAIFTDSEKAFDTFSWQFLFKTLKCFNFGNNFIHWIQTIYNQLLCCVINNGHASDFFELTRGIRQGCPLSALLFIIVAEVMAINIRKNRNIQGIKFGETEIKLTQFADDTTLFLNNDQSLKFSLDLLEHYQHCAGLKLNKEKSEIVQLGNPSVKLLRHGLKLVKGPIKTLGIWIGKSCAETSKINFDEDSKNSIIY